MILWDDMGQRWSKMVKGCQSHGARAYIVRSITKEGSADGATEVRLASRAALASPWLFFMVPTGMIMKLGSMFSGWTDTIQNMISNPSIHQSTGHRGIPRS